MEVKIVNDNTDKIIAAKNEAIKKALTEIGEQTVKFAKALCPVGTSESTGKQGYRGGTLRKSISYQVNEKENQVIIGSNVVYAPFVELGTGPHFTPPPEWETFAPYMKKGKGHGYVKPRPFLRPAIEDHKSDIKKIIEDELK